MTDQADDDDLRGLNIEDLFIDNDQIFDLRGSLESVISSKGNSDRALSLTVVPSGEPQNKGTKYYVVNNETGEKTYAGKVAYYKGRRGISRTSDLLKFDRFEFENEFGTWAHFIWPTVMAESGGRYISINAWDRAHFTWGFYQLAAHTANDNLILLMRELVQLPLCKYFFPDLTIKNGKVAQIVNGNAKLLESEVQVPVGNGTETQIPDFMQYLNPSSYKVEEREVVNAAKFAIWAINDPEMRRKTVAVSVEIMRRKLKYWANAFDLHGKRPELGIWISDIFHHGRGNRNKVRNALAKPSFSQQLDALFEIDNSGNHLNRRETVRQKVNDLIDEHRFDGKSIGHGDLSL